MVYTKLYAHLLSQRQGQDLNLHGIAAWDCQPTNDGLDLAGISTLRLTQRSASTDDKQIHTLQRCSVTFRSKPDQFMFINSATLP